MDTINKIISAYKNLAPLSVLILALDQLTKYLVRANLQPGEIFPQGHPIVHYARIINWHNTGALLGIFKGQQTVITIFAIIVSMAIIIYYPRVSEKERAIRLALVLMLSGSLGNLIDRLHQGFVTDFISIGNLPAYNIADLSLFAAILTLFVVWYRWDDKAKEKQGGVAPKKAGMDE